MSFLQRAKQELEDAWQLFLAPALPSFLPWRLAWSCYALLSRNTLLFREAVQPAAAVASQHIPDLDVDAFSRRSRLMHLLDAADLFLAQRTRTQQAPDQHFCVKGAWPTDGAFIAVGFHYGTGMWMLRDVLRTQRRLVSVLAPLNAEDFRHHRLRFKYLRLRKCEIERSCGIPVVEPPGIRKLVSALKRGEAVVSLLDIPPHLAPHRQVPVQLLGQNVSLPSGIIALAKKMHVPVVPFWIETDARGFRTLVIDKPHDPTDSVAIINYCATQLDRLIRADPAAWHFWPIWSQWINDAQPLHVSSACLRSKIRNDVCSEQVEG